MASLDALCAVCVLFIEPGAYSRPMTGRHISGASTNSQYGRDWHPLQKTWHSGEAPGCLSPIRWMLRGAIPASSAGKLGQSLTIAMAYTGPAVFIRAVAP